MPHVADKYRGKVEYELVYRELITAAQYRGTVTYQEIAMIMGIPTVGSYMGSQTGWILGEISEDEFNAGRPMLSAVAVGVAGTPGDGFYTLAKKFGKLNDDSPEARIRFWAKERDEVYQTWQRKIYNPKKAENRPVGQDLSDRGD
jgi:hypothetical protein